MEVFIETYRTFDILFDPSRESFLAVSNRFDWQTKGKKSFASVKSDIDEYIKANLTFKPFVVQATPSSFKGANKITITGIRKDGAFVYLDDKGKPEQLSRYDMKDYSTYNPDNDAIIEELKALDSQVKELNRKKDALYKQFVPGRPLEDIQKDYTV